MCEIIVIDIVIFYVISSSFFQAMLNFSKYVEPIENGEGISIFNSNLLIFVCYVDY